MDQVDPEVMEQMRSWAKDCEWREAEDNCLTSEEYINELSDEEVLAGVDQHYSGGAREFVREMHPA